MVWEELPNMFLLFFPGNDVSCTQCPHKCIYALNNNNTFISKFQELHKRASLLFNQKKKKVIFYSYQTVKAQKHSKLKSLFDTRKRKKIKNKTKQKETKSRKYFNLNHL